jgi:BolA family transcriptional regulator, general stress-responsive regulator
MSLQSLIEQKLADALAPQHLEVHNESGGHRVPPGSETHFKVVVVSPLFEGARLVERHRRVNGLLAEEFGRGLHALAIHTYTEPEWRARFGGAPMSPPCAGQKRPAADDATGR